MPDFLYTSPRTNRSYRLVPDDPNYVPTELDKQEYAAYIEQQETASAQPAPTQLTAEAPDSGQSIGGARLSSAIQGITTIPGTIAQGVGATFLSPFGITALEESGKYAAQKARELTPIDPKYQGNLSVELFGAGGQAVGQLASALATGGGTIGTNVALAQAAAMGAASGAESAERRGLTGINRLNEVLGYGASEVITERMFGLGSKSFFKPAAGLQAKAVKAGTTILGEGVEESAAGALTNIVSNLTAVGTNIPSPDILSVDALKSYARQGLSGLVGGTVFAGAQMAMGEQATSQPTTTVTGRDPNTGATVDISDLTEQQIEDRGFTDVRTSVIPDSSLTAEIIESPNERVANILTEVGLNSATPVENQAFIDSLNQAGIPVDPAIVAAPAAPTAEAPAPAAPTAEAPAPTAAPAVPTAAAALIPVSPTAAEAPIPTVEATPIETGVAPAAQPPITPPAVEPTPTPTPTPDATQIGQVTESDLSKYPDGNEVGPPTETGDRNRPVESGQVEQAVAQEQTVIPSLPSGATPTTPGSLPQPMPRGSGEAAPGVTPTAAAPTAAAPTAAAPTAAAPTAAAAEAPTAAAPTAAAQTAAAAPTAAAAAAPTAAATPTETVEEPEAPDRQQNSDIFGQDDPNVDPNAQVDDYLAETPTESLAEDLAQFFGVADRPKEVQSFNELINNFIKPFVFDSSLPVSESQSLKAQELLDSLSPGSDMNAFSQRMIAMDPRLGSMDAVPGAVLGELYNYALKLNDNGAFYQSMRDLGSKLPYSYGSSGESAGRGLGIISFYVRKSARFKALNQHENSANKKAATKGVATAEQLAAISRASNDGASEAKLESNLSAADADGTNVISTLNALSANAAPVEPPVEETRRTVTAFDLTTGVKAEENVDPEGFKQRQKASKKAKNKPKKDKGIPPALEGDGDKTYSLAETPLGQTKGKVTKADVFSAAARLFNLRPTNIVVIDTEVPNARGKQYAGEVDLSTKVITINLRNVSDVEHLDRVLQEEVDHLVFQDPAVQADVKLLTENVPAELVQDMQDQGYEDSVQKEEAVIRYARNLASNAQTKSLWQNLLESIKSAFRRIFNSPPTQYELTRAAQRFVARSAEGYPTQGSGTGQRSSLTPEDLRIDQEYLAAVEAGDMKTAQRLVDEAAKAAGYDTVGMHGTNAHAYSPGETITIFNTRPMSGRGAAFFSSSEELAKEYGEKVYRNYLQFNNPLAVLVNGQNWSGISPETKINAEVTPEIISRKERSNADLNEIFFDLFGDKPAAFDPAKVKINSLMDVTGVGSPMETDQIAKKARELGYDGVIFKGVKDSPTAGSMYGQNTSDVFAVFSPNQIKSAEPITRDDAGNIIPPSKRFQKTSDDIRYSVTPTAEDANESEKYFPPTVQIFGEKVVATAVEVQSIREIYETVKSQVFDYTQEVSEDATKAARDLFDRIRPTEDGPADISWLKEIDSRTATPGAVIGALYAYSDKMQDGGRFQQEILDAIELSKYFPTESFTDFWTTSGTGGTLREAGRGLNAVSYIINGLNKLQNVHSNRRIRIEAAAKKLGISEADVRAIDNITSVAPSAEAVAEGMGEIAAKIEKTLLLPGSNDPTKNHDNSPATDPKSIEQISAQKLVKDATKKDKKPKDTTQTDAVTAIVQDHLEKKGGQLEADLTQKLTEAGMSPEAAKKLATNTEKKLERDAKKESEREAKALEGAKELSDADRVARRITKKLLSTKDEVAKRKIHPIVALVARYFKANGKLSEEQLENELAALGVSTEIGRELVDAATAELGKRQAIKAARDKARKDNAATRSAENFTKNWEKSQDPTQQTEKKAPDPVRAFLNESSKVVRGQIHFDLSPNGKALFFDTVYTRLINLNVSPEAAMAATSAAYQKYLTNRANQIAKLRDTVAKEGLAKALAKQILNISRAQQRDPEFAKQFIEQTLIDAGVPQDVANASVPLLLPSFQKTLADAREKALMDFINGRPPSAKRIPKEKLDDLRKAVRLGATNPDYQPSTPFAKANGWQNFTRAEHDEMALQDEIASDPLQTNQERQLALSKIAKIAAKRMPKNNKLSLFAEIYRNSALSNFLSTGGIQVWTPVFSAAVRSFTDGVRGLTQEKNLNRFIASLEGFLRAASPTALKAELISSFGQNITTYNKAYEIDDLSQLHALLLDGIETWKTTKSPLKKAKALISITYGSMDYVRRSYASLDNVSQSVFYRQIMDLGMRDIILSKGGSETDFKNLISNRTRYHEQLVTELISQGQSPSRAWVNASELSYRQMNGDLVDIYGEDVAVEIQAKDEMSRKESARELGVAPDEELDGHVIPVLIDTIKGLSKAADKRFAESGKLTTLILFGFPVTALKVMNRSLDYSPIGILRGVMSERESKEFANDPEYKSKYPSYKTDTQKQQRMAEAAVGTAAMIMFLMMVLNEREKEPEDRMFMVHNAGPRDRAARQIWRAAGNEPQSVQFRFSKDSPWLGVSWAKAGLEVFTPVFATAGATFDSMDPTIRREDAYDQIMVFFSQTLASMSRPLSSVQDTAGVVSGKEMSLSGRSLANQVGFRASSFLPWSSMARNYNKWQGARDTTNAGSAFAAMIPIVGPSLTEPALNSLGDPVGKTPNEYSYKIGTAIPVSVGFRREDTPLYEFLLNKGKFPTTISRPTQEKKYGQMTNETWRKFVEIRGKTLKSLILQRKESLDKMDSEKYDDMIENLTRIANDRARNELKLRPAKK